MTTTEKEEDLFKFKKKSILTMIKSTPMKNTETIHYPPDSKVGCNFRYNEETRLSVADPTLPGKLVVDINDKFTWNYNQKSGKVEK